MVSIIHGPSGPGARFFIVGLGIGQYTWLACKTDISEEVRREIKKVRCCLEHLHNSTVCLIAL